MRAVHATALMIALAVSAFAADKIQPLNVKTGLWNVTFTTNMTGAPPIPADRVEKLSPEQRARLEQMWKDRQAKGPQTKTRMHCVTEEQLKDRAFTEDNASCTRTVITSSSKELNVRVKCSSDEGTRTSLYHIQAVSSEDVKGAIRIENSAEGRTLEVTNDFTAKWAGPVCGTVK